MCIGWCIGKGMRAVWCVYSLEELVYLYDWCEGVGNRVI